ncbi:hypothetical protein GBA52_006224 [Prunus armeniaca]|nr:hypothetical protein GBA52_006224 [Prunus armeniaca]
MESSFCHMLSEHESNFTPATRRFSIDSSPSDALRSIEQSHICSVLTFNQEEWPKSFLKTLNGNFKLLKVLDFADAPKYQLLKYMGDLYLLKYLSLRNTKVKLLPDSKQALCSLSVVCKNFSDERLHGKPITDHGVVVCQFSKEIWAGLHGKPEETHWPFQGN